jgi:hypothetical protein
MPGSTKGFPIRKPYETPCLSHEVVPLLYTLGRCFDACFCEPTFGIPAAVISRSIMP